MAFCPLCGKKLPPNGICSCGKTIDANGNIVDNGAGSVQDANQQPASSVQQAAAPVQQAAAPVQQAAAPVQQAAAPVQQAAAPVQQAAAPVQQAAAPVQQAAAPVQQAAAPVQQAAAPVQQAAAPVQQPIPNAQSVQGNQIQYQQQPMYAAPSGPNIFGEAFKMFGKVFTGPGTANETALAGKLPVGSGLVLGGIYFLIVWISMLLLLIGNCNGGYGHFKFLPAFGFSALGAFVFSGLRVASAGLLKAFSGNKNIPFTSVLSAVFVDSILLDCLLFLMMFFQFATIYFAVFFMLIYFGVLVYQQYILLQKLSGNSSANKQFWCMFALLCIYALVIMLCYLIFRNAPNGAITM